MLTTVPTIETSTAIAADPDVVWATLTDFTADRAWDPFFARLDGAAVPGGTLTVTITPPGGRPMTFSPRVEVADGRRLAWLGRLWLPGLFDGRHEFVLTPQPDGTTLFEHREVFRGVLTRLGGSFAGTRAGFEAFNAAFRARCEAADRRSAAAPGPGH